MAKLKNRQMKKMDKTQKAEKMEAIYRLGIAVICGLLIGFLLKSLF